MGHRNKPTVNQKSFFHTITRRLKIMTIIVFNRYLYVHSIIIKRFCFCLMKLMKNIKTIKLMENFMGHHYTKSLCLIRSRWSGHHSISSYLIGYKAGITVDFTIIYRTLLGDVFRRKIHTTVQTEPRIAQFLK